MRMFSTCGLVQAWDVFRTEECTQVPWSNHPEMAAVADAQPRLVAQSNLEQVTFQRGLQEHENFVQCNRSPSVPTRTMARSSINEHHVRVSEEVRCRRSKGVVLGGKLQQTSGCQSLCTVAQVAERHVRPCITRPSPHAVLLQHKMMRRTDQAEQMIEIDQRHRKELAFAFECALDRSKRT